MTYNDPPFGFLSLLAAVIERAMLDLKGHGSRCRKIETDRAMAFILSEECEAWCLELKIDHEVIKEKAVELYRSVLEKEPFTALQKRGRKPINIKRHIRIRQSPVKRRIGNDR